EDKNRLEALRAGFTRGVLPDMVDLAITRAALPRLGGAETPPKPPGLTATDGPPSTPRGSPPGAERRVLSVSFGSVLREEGVILVSFRDVTVDRATAVELVKTKEFLERVIESSVDAIISADMRGTIKLFNRAAERLTGYEAREVVRRTSARDLYPEGTAQHIMRLINSREHGGPGRLESLGTFWGRR